jgi:alpha-glucosidase
VRTTFNLTPAQDWRYTWVQKLPNITASPAKFKIDPYYTKFSWAREFPVVGRGASDEAMLKANDTIRKMFAYRHDILKALINEGVKLVVLGKNEFIASLPETKNLKVDQLARFLEYSADHKLIVVPEENILGRVADPLVGDNQIVRLFARAAYDLCANRPVDPNWDNRGRAVQQYELRVTRLDVRFKERLDKLLQNARERKQWRGTGALHDPADYFARAVLAYFDAAGQVHPPEDTPHPISSREDLRRYDPELFDFVAETMAYQGHVDWRLPR